MDSEVIKLIHLSTQCVKCNQIKQAVAILEKASRLINDNTQISVKVFTLINLATCYARLKSFRKSDEILSEGLDEVKDDWLRTCVLVNLAVVKSELGANDQALDIDLTVLKNLNNISNGINKFTVEVAVCRNIAILCSGFKQTEKARKFDLHARQIALQNLGPSNLLTIVLDQMRIRDFSPSQFRLKRDEDKKTSFLNKIRFITGERLQPMSNNRNPWTKRLKSLHLQPIPINPVQESKQISNQDFEIASHKKLFDKNKKAASERVNYQVKSQSSQDRSQILPKKHKIIKIVNSKDLKIKKERNKAAVIIQKNFRMHSARQKFLLFRKIGQRVEYRMERFEMFNQEKIANLVVRESEEYEEFDDFCHGGSREGNLMRNFKGNGKLDVLKEEELKVVRNDGEGVEDLPDGKIIKIFFDDVEVGNEEIKNEIVNIVESKIEKAIENKIEIIRNDESELRDNGGLDDMDERSQSESKYSDDFKSSTSIHGSKHKQEEILKIGENSARIIQGYYRSHLFKKFKGLPIKKSTIAATKIQKAYRSFKSKSQNT